MRPIVTSCLCVSALLPHKQMINRSFTYALLRSLTANLRRARPPMGWRSWNAYHTDISQTLLTEAARVLAVPRVSAAAGPATAAANSSFAALGFVFVGIDEGWAKCGAGVNGSFHRLDGSPIVDLEKFPSMKQLTDHIHALGLRAGWYAACDGCTERSWVGAEHIATHMRGTVKAIVDYGFDSIKLDSGSEFK